MAQLVFELQQHTPILHFQHGQPGATLRATEVKPKLDRFILGILAKKHTQLNPEWLIGPDKKSLDYRMRITLRNEGRKEYWVCSQANPKQKLDPIALIKKSPYFAQMETDKILQKRFDQKIWNTIDKKGLFWLNTVKVTLFSLHPSLLEEVKKLIQDFFICTNFGTRSDKGFGSFTVVRINGEYVSTSVEKALLNQYDIVYKRTDPIRNAYDVEGVNLVFETITDDYNKIRSFMETYVRNGRFGENLEWDRTFIKRKVNKEEPHEEDYIYVRGLLGLPSSYSYEELLGKPEVKISDKDEEVERFPSPLFFKVIKGSIFIAGHASATECMLDKRIRIECNASRKPSYLSTPETFNLKNYLSEAIRTKKLKYQLVKSSYFVNR